MLSKICAIFICITAAIALWYTCRLVPLLFAYWELSTPVAAQVSHWEVRELSTSRYAIEAAYAYQEQGRSYFGKTLFDSPVYLNVYAATADLDRWQNQAWQAWVCQAHPERSTLQRHFPAKSLVHALLTFAVFLYFLLLNFFKRDASSRQ